MATTVAPIFGGWAYGVLIAAPLVTGIITAATPRAVRRARDMVDRAAARWDAWLLAPQPRNTNRRRRPPTPRGAR